MLNDVMLNYFHTVMKIPATKVKVKDP